MKISFAFCLMFLIISFFSCNGQNKKMPSSDCIALNNQGNDYLTKFTCGDKKALLKAIDLLKQAINCDTSYLVAYRNLTIAYDWNHDYMKELTVFRKLLILSHNYPEIITEKAKVFEKLNMLDSARRNYQLARQRLSDSLHIHPSNARFVSDFLLVLALTDGQDAALKELNRRITICPELKPKLISEYYFYQNFDKRAYLYDLMQ